MLAEEQQAASLYEQLAYKEAAERVRAAEILFARAAMQPVEGLSSTRYGK